MSDQARITLAHGNGGRRMRELIEDVFARHLGGADLDVEADAARLGPFTGELMTSVDGFTVQPLSFPGGDIGSLAVHGTVNDLAVSGAEPVYLTLSAIIEEGLPLADLETHVASLAAAAKSAGVTVVAGDTKVVPRGAGGGLYLATTGIGRRSDRLDLGMSRVRPGDRILVSGSVGDHGACVMLAREEFGLSGELASDSACVLPLVRALHGLEGVHFLRDPTRGGLATVAHEIASAAGCQLRLRAAEIPVKPQVDAICEMLGYDPLYLACEGRVVAVVESVGADEALERWRATEQGSAAAIIGEVQAERAGRVVLETELGGERLLEELEDDPLPRIC